MRSASLASPPAIGWWPSGPGERCLSLHLLPRLVQLRQLQHQLFELRVVLFFREVGFVVAELRDFELEGVALGAELGALPLAPKLSFI